LSHLIPYFNSRLKSSIQSTTVAVLKGAFYVPKSRETLRRGFVNRFAIAINFKGFRNMLLIS